MPDIPPVPSACGGPSLQELRRLDCGELNDLETRRVRSHVGGCAHCQRVMRDFEAERAALRTVLPFATLDARLQQRPPEWSRFIRRLLLGLLIPAGATAAFVLAPAAQLSRSPAEDNGIRVKGDSGPSLDFFVQTGDGSRTGHDGEALHAGDRIRLRYRTGDSAYVLIVGVDADGHVFPYLTDGDRSARAETGLVLAPNAVTLDNDQRPERVYALYSAEPIGVDEVKPAARDALQSVGGHVDQLGALPVQGAVQRTILINKAPR